MKKMTILLLFLFFCVRATAPEFKTLIILRTDEIKPYERLWKAVCQVESSGNPFAYNKEEDAVGISQIREIRIRDYNKLTGKNYKLSEMFDPVKSKEVFMYYASKFSTHNIERIAKRWNGSGPLTEIYWKKIKIKL